MVRYLFRLKKMFASHRSQMVGKSVLNIFIVFFETNILLYLLICLSIHLVSVFYHSLYKGHIFLS